jgi:y4mF family transcriptional regulator
MPKFSITLPYGGIESAPLSLTPKGLGRIVKKERNALGLTQADLALTSGTGIRFISDLENGKPTCQIGKILTVLKTLGLRLSLFPPNGPLGS